MATEGNDSTAENAGVENVSKDVLEAIHLLAQGKRNMMCLEISQAVQQFQSACEILGRTYGEMADECGDAYYWYGKSLLELSRMEGGVIGDAVPAESDESQSENDNSEVDQDTTNDGGESATGSEDDEDTGVLSEDIEEEEAEFGTDKVKQTTCISHSESAEKACNVIGNNINNELSGELKDEVQKESNDNAVLLHVENCVNQELGKPDSYASSSTKTEHQNNAQEEDDVSNLQLAWETLELAKVIYGRHNTRDMKLKLADTYLKLGEIGMETEQFEQSVIDLTSSLSLLKAYLSPEDRHIAETLYQLGLACQLDKRYDDAIKHFNNAIEVLESRVALQRGIVSGEIQPELVSEATDGFYSPHELASKEIEEILTIIPDIRAKIEDVIDEQRSEERVRIMMNSLNQPLSSINPLTSSSSLHCSSSDGSVSHVGEGVSMCQSDGSSLGNNQSGKVPVNNITHLIRKKRKEDNTNDCPEVKRACTLHVNSSQDVELSAEMSAGLSTSHMNGTSADSNSSINLDSHHINGESCNGEGEN